MFLSSIIEGLKCHRIKWFACARYGWYGDWLFLKLVVRDVFNKRLMLVVSNNLNVCNLTRTVGSFKKRTMGIQNFFVCRNE